MTTAAQAIAWEAKYISHAGSNGGDFMWALAGAPGYAGSAWCGATQFACAKALGLDLGPFTLASVIYVPSAINVAKAHGLWRPSVQSKPGDWVTFDWSGRETGGDHIGMIVENDPTKSYVKTIEGNAGAKANGQRGVDYHTRERSLISGTINRQSAYGKASTPPKAPVTKPTTKPAAKAAVYVAGTKVVTAWQKFEKTSADGKISSQDIGRKGNAPAASWTTIQWVAANKAQGSQLIKAAQKRLKVSNPDGLLGPLTVKAIQKWLGVTQDGILGPKSVEALCKKLGVS